MNNNAEFEMVSGTVDSITYKNKENGYAVLTLKSKNDYIVLTGTLSHVNEGDSVVAYGSYTMHPTYGMQFKCDAVEISVPKTNAQILKYLSSGAIKGIGPATALKIVETFKDSTFEVIENSPTRLATIKGITIDKAVSISEQFKMQFGIRDIMVGLSKFKINPSEAADIFKVFGVESIEIINRNPYVLCSNEIGFSFNRAEEIAEQFHIASDDINRISAGILYVLNANLSNGHTCLPRNKLVDVSSKLLSLDYDVVNNGVVHLIDCFKIYSYLIEDKEHIFLPEYADAEIYIANRVKSSLHNNMPLTKISDKELAFVEDRLGIEFDNVQIDSVNAAMENSLFILTGGPGTGKTTTLNAIIEIFDNRGFNIALAAPTGRAAKRMNELTGKEAKTIHRLLEAEQGKDHKMYFAKNKQHQLDFDVIIVDEMSMVDVQLFKALLEAIRNTTRIIMVGDSDQLPSVGAGNVLNDLISSGTVPYVRLSKVYRQAEESAIITTAHSILDGEIPDDFENKNDFFFLKKSSSASVVKTVLNLCCDRLPSAYDFDVLNDIQVLCPSRKNECGTNNINRLLQEELNPLSKNDPELIYKGISFRVGDKVIQNKNDYDISWQSFSGETGSGVYNGDIGFIYDIDLKNRMLTVQFDDKIAEYYEENLNVLEHAYAITVHKSQGCEFECVIVPLFDASSLLLYRNLLYTAITRAKKLIVFVGNTEMYCKMIENNRKTLRYTALKHFIEE